MPTLNATFNLFDGYNKTINSIITGTDKATNKVLAASGATDSFNTSLNKVGKNTTGLDSVIGKMAKIISIGLLAKKAIDGMIGGLKISTLQTSQLNSLQANYGDVLGSNVYDWVAGYAADSVLGREDLMQSVSMSAPFIRSQQQLEKYTKFVERLYAKDPTQGASGASFAMKEIMSGDVMSMRSRYGITGFSGEEIRNYISSGNMDGLFKYMDDVFNKFGATDKLVEKNLNNLASQWNIFTSNFKTKFADAMKTVEKKAGPLVDKLNQMLDTGKLDSFINSFVKGSEVVVESVDWLIDNLIEVNNWIKENKSEAMLFVGVFVGTEMTLAVSNISKIAAGMSTIAWAATAAGTIVVGVGLAFIKFGEYTEMLIGGVVGGTYVIVGSVTNLITASLNGLIGFGVAFDNLIKGAVNSTISGVNWITTALNKIPGVDLGLSDMWGGFMPENPYFDYLNLGEEYKKGYDEGAIFSNMVTDGLTWDNKSGGNMGASEKGPSPQGNSDYWRNYGLITGSDDLWAGLENNLDKPIEVVGKGGKSIKVDMSKQDLKYLKDVAEREYINKFSTATLAPNVTVQFTGDIHKDVDTDKMYKRIGKIMKEQIAIVAEG